MPTLQAQLHDLASSFAASVLNAIKGASLEDLVGESGRGRPPTSRGGNGASEARTRKAPKQGGRLPRRSAEDIAKALDQVVTLVKKNADGMRAEEIRATLGMQAKEMPRILGEGLRSKKLKSKGQKRATTYLAR